MVQKDDWRLGMGTEERLQGETFYRIPFVKLRPEWDHEHCEFCWAKISEYEGDLHEAYCTQRENGRGARWVCPECYRDFKDMFSFREGK